MRGFKAKRKDKKMRGFKAFNEDLTCRGFRYEIGHTYEFNGKPIPDKQGFHFCKSIADCYEYYSRTNDTRICVIDAIGNISTDDDINYCTNKIVILEEITEEWKKRGNGSASNTGYCNIGNYNAGNCNTGDYNTGYYNIGNYNAGNRNTENYNTGNYNTGDRNTGVFNTENPLLTFFDKPSEWTYDQWFYSDARRILEKMEQKVVEWICEKDMSDEEKVKNPTHKTTEGYLKVYDIDESRQLCWDSLSEDEKQVFRNLPNYDEEKFAAILGIKLK